jgi:hypothetical protein
MSLRMRTPHCKEAVEYLTRLSDEHEQDEPVSLGSFHPSILLTFRSHIVQWVLDNGSSRHCV